MSKLENEHPDTRTHSADKQMDAGHADSVVRAQIRLIINIQLWIIILSANMFGREHSFAYNEILVTDVEINRQPMNDDRDASLVVQVVRSMLCYAISRSSSKRCRRRSSQ
ncbi:hypothetical protein CBL_02837 [Carabus blaptoides fortunei]